ncbi:MAG: DEAD/DEAH box helicase family protein [Deltaproteobacteria bacterium]|nr:DEAD/DEAH box helicase family protein [Deltaproteobacteria bacterium]
MSWSERGDANGTTSPRESRFRLRLLAEQLSARRPDDQPGRIVRALRQALIDLNPHQVEAAVAGLHSLRDRGLVLADEVGLGKTIEAGLVLAQLAAEARPRLLVLTPATLRAQWARELEEKLGLEATIVDGQTESRERRARGSGGSVFDRPREIVIASHPFAARRALELRGIRWDCVVIDEAHRLRGAHRGSKTAQALRAALEGRPKLLLTATPMQNGLGELYGLLSFLDVDVLGPFDQFRRLFPDSLEGSTAQSLRTRVQPFVHRTLRRQVREYVRYTERKSILCEFTPTAAEARLYQEVSEYLADPEVLAIDPARRHLLVLVYRKLLASSPAAIAGTLELLAGSLEGRLERGDHEPEETALDEDAARLLLELEEEREPGEEPSEKKRPPATPSRLRDESARLRDLARLARGIRRPAKTEALLRALDRAFTEALSRGWPEKAVVFTESRRTQIALKSELDAAGFAGQVLELHGGSGDSAARAAIVDGFRDRAKILILTEAGAEGLNLQFANLVVNYDLPWNPQRIEQRIGRCHRYGQVRDVVVLNFLASENAAEARLYELLSKKLELFDGVFGATDEPLGALGNGAEFERRVFEILDSCRSEGAIQGAFDALQAEVEAQISSKMAAARAQICDHFDDEIRARLRMTGSATLDALAQDEKALVSLMRGAMPDAELDGHGRLYLPSEGGRTLETARGERTAAGDFLTVDHPLASRLIEDLRREPAAEIRYTLFEYTAGNHRISRLAPFLGSEGWWLVHRLSFDGPVAEDHLLHVVVLRTPDDETVILDEAQTHSLLEVRSCDVDRRSRLRAASLASRHGEEALAPRIAAVQAQVTARAQAELARAREEIEVALEDRLAALRELTAQAEAAWKGERASGQKDDVDRRFRELVRAMDREAEERTRATKRRSDRLADIEARAPLEMTRTLVGSTYFWLE